MRRIYASSAGGCPTISTPLSIPSSSSCNTGSRGSQAQRPASALGKLETLLAQTQLARAEAVPLVAELIALPLPAERYSALRLTPEQQRQRTFDAVLALVETLAAQQPVLLIVEDLHWVDPSTLELLTLLLDQVPTLRLYLVLTCRPTFQPSWGFRTHLTSLTLTPLTRSHVETMVQGMLRGHLLPASVLAQIVAQTDGIPLFVEEVTKAVVEAGLSTGGPAQDAATGPLPALAIPVTLHEALLARLDRLGSAKGVAQLGATIGREFAYTLLRAVAPLEDEALQRDLATLVAAELLYQRGQPPRAIYRFKHALIQEAAYESVLRSVRRHTHQRIVQVLEAQFPETVVTAARTAGPPCAAGRAVGAGRDLFPAGWGAGAGPLGLSGGGGCLRAGAGGRTAPPREPRHTRAGHRSPPRAAQCALSLGRTRAALRLLTGRPSPC